MSGEEAENRLYLMQLFKNVPALAISSPETISIFFYKMNPLLRRIRPDDVEEVEALGRKMQSFMGYGLAAVPTVALGSHAFLSRYWPARYPRKLMVLANYLLPVLIGGAISSRVLAGLERRKADVVAKYQFTQQDLQEASDFLLEQVKAGKLYLQDEKLNYNDGTNILHLS